MTLRQMITLATVLTLAACGGTADIAGPGGGDDGSSTPAVAVVDVDPDGICTLAPGPYEDPYSDESWTVEGPKTRLVSVDVIDTVGDTVEVGPNDVDWSSTAPDVATAFKTAPDSARVEMYAEGTAEVRATVDGVVGDYTVLVSDSIDWTTPEERENGAGFGGVTCAHL